MNSENGSSDWLVFPGNQLLDQHHTLPISQAQLVRLVSRYLVELGVNLPSDSLLKPIALAILELAPSTSDKSLPPLA